MKSHPLDGSGLDQQLFQQFEDASSWLKQTLPKLLPIAAGLLLLFWLASGIYSVHPGHVG